MPSPFPGMNPYLESESVFHDFHQSLIEHVKYAIAPQVRPRYFVQTDFSIYLHEHDADARRSLGRPDVYLTDRGAGGVATVARATASSPIDSIIPEAVDEERILNLQVVDRDTDEVVTVIEILSHSNKLRSDDRGAYLNKRKSYIHSGLNLVEIDLLRAGEPMPVLDRFDAPYRVIVARRARRPHVSVYPIALRDRLPVIPIPLRDSDPDASVDLQEALNTVYDVNYYGDRIYDRPLEPLLGEADARWVTDLAREARARAAEAST